MSKTQRPDDQFREERLIKDRLRELENAISANNNFLAGDIKATARPSAPIGWLMCDGTAYLRTQYPELFTALGGAASTYGLPNGTTFNVPNLKGKVPVGRDAAQIEFDVLGEAPGAKAHVLIPNETAMRAHSHGGATGSMNRSNPHSHTIWLMNNGGGAVSVWYVGLGTGSPFRHDGSSFADATDINHEHAIPTEAAVNGAAHNNIQPSLVINYMIYAGA